MSGSTKARVRVPAGSAPAEPKAFMTGDSFQNFAAQLGYGTQNLSTANKYGFNPITRNHTTLEWMYRGSWLVKQIVDAVADDMTRAGVSIESEMEPDDMEEFTKYFQTNLIWQRLNSTIKWSRLYGGCVALMMIEGQRTDTPLRTDTIMKDQFQGLLVLDRWMLWPDLTQTVSNPGPDFGQPEFYQIIADVRGLPKMRIHHSRLIRMDGVELPYWQTISENGWSLSVIEPLLDRMVAFDSVTQGAAQLAFKAHLRVVRVEGLRELIAAGGLVYQAFLQQMAIIRLMQTNEGMTVLDKEDEFQANSYSFAGLPDLLHTFGEQLSGASQIPLTRLFGQSPNGMSATGESDMRNYYDSIKAQQEARLRRPLNVLFDVMHRSKFGYQLPDDFNWSFSPLWQLSESEKATIAGQVTVMVDQARTGGLIGTETALKELRQSSRITGIWSNIKDSDIEAAKQDDLLPDPATMGQQPGEPGAGQTPHAPGATPPTGGPKPPAGGGAKGAGLEGSESDDDAEGPSTVIARRLRRYNPMVSKMFPNRKGLTMKDLPLYATPILRDKNDVLQSFGHLANGHTVADVANLMTHDKYPMRDVHGMTVVVETAKGTTRTGYGWATQVKADYGYISGTGSAEGGSEQFDAFIGEQPDVDTVYVIQQKNPITGEHDEEKAMLCFGSKQEAVAAYEGSYADGKNRVGRVLTTSIEGLKSYLVSRWPHDTSKGPDHTLPSHA